MSEKKCTVCKKTKSLEDFQNEIHGKQGKYSQCQECRNAAQRKIKNAGENHAMRLSFLGVKSSVNSWGSYA